jgi:hypothetical protein
VTQLPESTFDAVRRWLSDDNDVAPAAAWAADVLEAGFDDDAVVRLAVLDLDEREEVRRLLPLALAVVGLDPLDREMLTILFECRLVERLIGGTISVDGFLQHGVDIWMQTPGTDREWVYDHLTEYLGLVRNGDYTDPTITSSSDEKAWLLEELAT